MKPRILLVEDEPGVLLVLTDLLSAEGYQVEIAANGRLGLQRATSESFDLLILDIMLPGGVDGFAICHAARQRGFDGGVLMLTARGLVVDQIKGLRNGADDYLVKPFDPDELLARVSALLRRVHKAGLTPVMRVEFGSIVADFAQEKFFKDGLPLSLSGKESDLLRLLINHRGQVLSRDTILAQVWNEQPHITPRTVDVHIAWLRQKVEETPERPVHVLAVQAKAIAFKNISTNQQPFFPQAFW